MVVLEPIVNESVIPQTVTSLMDKYDTSLYVISAKYDTSKFVSLSESGNSSAKGHVYFNMKHSF